MEQQFRKISIKFDKNKSIVYKLQYHQPGIFGGHSRYCKNLKQEYDILSELVHPNIIKVYEIDQNAHLPNNQQGCLISMEQAKYDFYKYQVQQRNQINLIEIRKLFAQLSDAFFYIHELDIVHNDIKSDNILCFGDQDKVQLLKVSDFGEATFEKRSMEEQYNAWTKRNLSYASPEIIRLVQTSQSKLKDMAPMDEKKNDVFSFGVLLFTTVFDFFPYQNLKSTRETDQLYKHIVQKQYSSFWNFNLAIKSKVAQIAQTYGQDFKNNLINLLQLLLSYDPNERITFSDVLSHTWFTCSDNQ